jgi:FG-GAP-like repeat
MPNLSFASANNFDINVTPGTSPTSVSLGDFNNDGKLDFATTTASGNNVLVALGNGNGSFSTTNNFAVASRPVSLSVGDFNRDGFLDIVTGNSATLGPGSISILFGNGSGTTFSPATTIPVGQNPIAITGDFNGDNQLDLATANYFDNNVSILLNSGNLVNGNAAFTLPTTVPVGTNPASIQFGDFNGDLTA